MSKDALEVIWYSHIIKQKTVPGEQPLVLHLFQYLCIASAKFFLVVGRKRKMKGSWLYSSYHLVESSDMAWQNGASWVEAGRRNSRKLGKKLQCWICFRRIHSSCLPIILALGRRQEAQELEVMLSCILSLRWAWAAWDLVSDLFPHKWKRKGCPTFVARTESER